MSSDLQTAFAPVAYPVLGAAGDVDRAARAEARGHAAGYAAGIRAAAAEITARAAEMESEHAALVARVAGEHAVAVAALTAAARALDARVAPVLADAEAAVVDAALELAETIVGAVIRSSIERAREGRGAFHVEAAVARALADVDPRVVIAVRLAPEDIAVLDEATRLAVPVQLVADATLQRGDAVADLPHGVVDARIGAAVDRARAALDRSAPGTATDIGSVPADASDHRAGGVA